MTEFSAVSEAHLGTFRRFNLSVQKGGMAGTAYQNYPENYPEIEIFMTNIQLTNEAL